MGDKFNFKDFIDSNFKGLIESSTDILYIYNFTTNSYDYISKSIKNIIGISAEKIIKEGMPLIFDNIHPDDLDNVTEIFNSLLDETFRGEYINIDYRIKNFETNQHLWRSDRIKIIRNEKSKITAVIGNSRDITEEKALASKISGWALKYQDLYNNAQIPLYRTRLSDGKLMECNEMLAEMLGYENKEHCLREHYSTKYYSDPVKRNELISCLMKDGQVSDFEIETRKIDGSLLWVSVSARLDQKKGYIEGVMRNITAEKILSKVEKMVLELVLDGKNNREIASELSRSVRTIECHRSNIMKKMGVSNLIELAKESIKLGLG